MTATTARTAAATLASATRAATLRAAGITVRRSGRVTLWDVYTQSWITRQPGDFADEVVASYASYGPAVRRALTGER
jgi:hypothetical protein